MTQFLKVEGNSDLVRDASNMAILNTNRTEYENYIRKRETMLAMKEEVSRNSQEIGIIKEDLSEIKQMLTALLKDRIKG
jgi:hypothetical protein